MAEMKDIVKVAVDAYHGNVEQYSVGQSMELLHKALIDANGGSTTLNYKNIRDGKCSGLFTLIEEVLSRTVVEGLQGDEYFNALVDFQICCRVNAVVFQNIFKNHFWHAACHHYYYVNNHPIVVSQWFLVINPADSLW